MVFISVENKPSFPSKEVTCDMNTCAIHTMNAVEIPTGQRPGKGWLIDNAIRNNRTITSLQVDQMRLKGGEQLPKVIQPLCRRIGCTHTFYKCQVLLSSQVSAVPFPSVKSVRK